MSVINIIARELGKGTFDKSCTADERMRLRQFVNNFKIIINKIKKQNKLKIKT